MVISVVEHFKARSPSVVTRGYRRTGSADSERVTQQHLTGPSYFGDEPWLIAQQTNAPVYVGGNRSLSAQSIEKAEDSRLIVLDDGFQQLGLHVDIPILVLPSQRPWESSLCLPLGEMREPLSAISRAKAVVLTGEDLGWTPFLRQYFPGLPVFRGKRVFSGLFDLNGDEVSLGKEPFGAFCGLADPSDFFQMLSSFGEFQWSEAFPDHYSYGSKDIEGLINQGKSRGLRYLVTTAKDWYKVKSGFEKSEIALVRCDISYQLSSEFWGFLEKEMNTTCSPG